ncbi:MAG: hypothetical protein M3068_10080 [Gemmatimonadota bacterium]|nr:hypothetical protein [Gemmatimonadota bacterium]
MEISPHVAPESDPRSPIASPLHPEIVDIAELLLLGALLRLGHEPSRQLSAEHADLRRTIRLFCEDARDLDLSAEQVIDVLKIAWAAIGHPGTGSAGVRGDQLLHAVVSMCISELYSAA